MGGANSQSVVQVPVGALQSTRLGFLMAHHDSLSLVLSFFGFQGLHVDLLSVIQTAGFSGEIFDVLSIVGE